MRAALYARYSTDNQSPTSIEDQLALCRKLAAQLGAEIVDECSDAALSGQAMANRLGLKALMRLAETRKLDLVIAEHTDRLSRSGGDTWTIYEDLRALGVRIVTVNQGEVGTLHVGMSGTMSALMIEEISRKTKRGLRSRVAAGRAAGGVAYGYRIPRSYRADGERERGLREIDPEAAVVVVRIFTDYANGASPISIASALNAAGVAGPRGGRWNSTTILGDPLRLAGLLRNELYRGVRVWGICPMVKDRRTGKRRRSPGPADQVIRQDVPDLRIVSEALWARVQAQIAACAVGPRGEQRGQRRPSTLLGRLIRCSECGGAMSRGGSGDNIRCSRRASQGAPACSNTRMPSYRQIELRVLASIQANLLHPDVVAAAIEEYRQSMAAARRAARLEVSSAERELAEVRRRAARLISQVEDGMPWKAIAERHSELSVRQEALEQQLAEIGKPTADVIELRPTAAGKYRELVEDLRQVLENPADRSKAEAHEAVRALIREVMFIPRQAKGEYDLEIVAELAPVLGLAPGDRLVRADNSRPCFGRSHECGPLQVRLSA